MNENQTGFLTRDELIELTGCSTKMGQRNVLVRNGISHSVRKDGWPAVTGYQVNHPSNHVSVEGAGTQPDIGALIGSDVYA